MKVGVQLLFLVGGWVRKKTKLMLYSTFIVVVVEVEVGKTVPFKPSE